MNLMHNLDTTVYKLGRRYADLTSSAFPLIEGINPPAFYLTDKHWELYHSKHHTEFEDETKY